MYLNRFSHWNIRKNTSAKEKDKLCARLLEDYAKGRDIPDLTPDQLKKLLRFFKAKSVCSLKETTLWNLLRTMNGHASVCWESRSDHLATNVSNASTDDDQSNVLLSYTPISAPTPTLMSPPWSERPPPPPCSPQEPVGQVAGQTTWRIVERSGPTPPLSLVGKCTVLEEVLHRTRTYYRSKLQQHALYRATRDGPDVDAGKTLPRSSESATCPLSQNKAFWTNIKSGIYFLKMKNDNLAWPLLREAGELVPLLCEQQPFTLLKDIFATISPVNTRICPALRVELLRLFTRTACEKLGPQHPISSICYRLWMDDGCGEMSMMALQLMLEDSEKALTTGDVELFDLKRTLIRLCRRNRDFLKAETLSMSLINAAEDQYGKNEVNTRLAMSELVYVLNDQSKYEEAAGICQDVLYRGQQDLGHAFPDERSVYAMEDMAEACENLGRHEDSIFWLRKALNSALEMWSGKASTVHIFDKLEAMYSKEGRDIEMEELRQQIFKAS
jgi:tetratricopeptide (TPR) repeat protein